MSTQPHTIVASTATVHPEAEIGPGCEIGPGAFIGPRVRLGPNCRVRPGAVIVQDTVLGAGNDIHPGAVLGGDPQDKGYNPAYPGALTVGDNNIFREGVTISRSTIAKDKDPAAVAPTRIGSGCFFMTNSHAGHNAVVGDNCILTNCACIAGHTVLGTGVIMSAFCYVHQFCRVGEGVMFQGSSGVSMHVPPFVVLSNLNQAVGLNRVGLRRNPAMTAQDRDEIKSVYQIFYGSSRSGLIADRLAEADSLTLGAPARRFVDFVRAALDDQPPYRRGLIGPVRSRARLSGRAAGEHE